MYLLNFEKLTETLSETEQLKYQKLTGNLRDIYKKDMAVMREVAKYNKDKIRLNHEAEMSKVREKYEASPDSKTSGALEKTINAHRRELEKAEEMTLQLNHSRQTYRREIDRFFMDQICPLLKVAAERSLEKSRKEDLEAASSWGIGYKASAVTMALEDILVRIETTMVPPKERRSLAGRAMFGYNFARQALSD